MFLQSPGWLACACSNRKSKARLPPLRFEGQTNGVTGHQRAEASENCMIVGRICTIKTPDGEVWYRITCEEQTDTAIRYADHRGWRRARDGTAGGGETQLPQRSARQRSGAARFLLRWRGQVAGYVHRAEGKGCLGIPRSEGEGRNQRRRAAFQWQCTLCAPIRRNADRPDRKS